MRKHLLLVIALLCVSTTTRAAAPGKETHFFNAALWPTIQIYKRSARIEGIVLNIWGENEQMAFALGFVNGSTGDSGGFTFGIYNYTDSYTGAQLGAVNWAHKNFTGLQWALFNYVAGTVTGAQVAAVNYATKLHGVQFGLINYAEFADWGIQIGIINVLAQNKKWFREFPSAVAPYMLLANWRF